jgi:hypothetical protein
MVLDSLAKNWNWSPKISLPQVLDEIARTRNKIRTGWRFPVPDEFTRPQFNPLSARPAEIEIFGGHPGPRRGGIPAAMVEHLHLDFAPDMSRTKLWWWTTAARTDVGGFAAVAAKIPTLHPVQNTGEHGFGRAIISACATARATRWSS